MVADGIRAILESYSDIEVVATLSNGQEVIEQVDHLSPDVILMDLNMPQLGGLSATEILLERNAEQRIVVLSMHDAPEYVSTAMRHGARGYILKDVPTDEIYTAIQTGRAEPGHLAGHLDRTRANHFAAAGAGQGQ